jgi:hypothetical protein
MQMTPLPSVRMLRARVPHDEHRSRWKLRLFAWPFRHRVASAASLVPGGNVQLDLSVASLLRERELQDEVLADARRRLEALEADPGTDELTLVMARHEVFRRKHEIAATFTS